MTAKRLPHLAGLVLAAAVLASCGIGLPTVLAPPTGIEATTDQIDQITVSWNPVAGATRYYVYRSDSPTPPLWTEGEYGPVPYAATNATSYVDAPLEPDVYYYQVSAVNLRTNAESEPSEVATGISRDGPIEWQSPTLIGARNTLRHAIDRSSPVGRPYILGVPNSSETGVVVQRMEFDGSLTTLGSAFGSVDGTVKRSADLAVDGGVVVVALVDAAGGGVELWKYDEADDAFALVNDALPTSADDDARALVGLAARTDDEFWLAYRGSGGAMVTYRLDASGVGTAQTAPLSDGDLADNQLVDMEIAAANATVMLGYEIEDESGDTTSVKVATSSGTDWDALVDVSGPATNVTTLDVAVDSVNGATWVVFADDAEYYINNAAGDRVDTLLSDDTGLSGTLTLSPQDLAVAARDGEVSLFYVDRNTNTGVIRSSTDDGASWTLASPDGGIGGDDLPIMDLISASDGRSFTAYASAPESIAFVRAYQ